MSITITNEHILYFIMAIFVAIQIYQQYQLDKTKKEMESIWQQISTWNTMVALKLLETQKELAKLNENKNNGEHTKENS